MPVVRPASLRTFPAPTCSPALPRAEAEDVPDADVSKEQLERSLRRKGHQPGRIPAIALRALDAAAGAACRAAGQEATEERKRALRGVFLLVGVPATVVAASQVLPTPCVVALDLAVLAINVTWWLDLSDLAVAQKRIERDVDALMQEQAEVEREQGFLVAIALDKQAELEALQAEKARVTAAEPLMSPGERLFWRSRLRVRASEVQEEVATAYAAEAHVMNRMAALSKEADGISLRSEELSERADAVLAPRWIAPRAWAPWSRN